MLLNNRLEASDIAVVEFTKGNGEWEEWAYIGPEHSNDNEEYTTYPEELVGLTGIRIRYLNQL